MLSSYTILKLLQILLLKSRLTPKNRDERDFIFQLDKKENVGVVYYIKFDSRKVFANGSSQRKIWYNDRRSIAICWYGNFIKAEGLFSIAVAAKRNKRIRKKLILNGNKSKY